MAGYDELIDLPASLLGVELLHDRSHCIYFVKDFFNYCLRLIIIHHSCKGPASRVRQTSIALLDY